MKNENRPRSGRQLVHDLLQSVNTTHIRLFTKEDGEADYMQGLRQLPVRWNPSYSSDQPGATPAVILAHELAHSWTIQWMKGAIEKKTPQGLRQGEVFSVQVQNQVGIEMGLKDFKIRTHYNLGTKQKPHMVPVPDHKEPFFPECDNSKCESMYKSASESGWGGF